MADGELAQPSDVVVRVTLAAICVTDVHIKHGGLPGFKPGAILGHELGGVVQEAGAGVPLSGSAIGLRLPRSVVWHLSGVLVLHFAQLSRAIHV